MLNQKANVGGHTGRRGVVKSKAPVRKISHLLRTQLNAKHARSPISPPVITPPDIATIDTKAFYMVRLNKAVDAGKQVIAKGVNTKVSGLVLAHIVTNAPTLMVAWIKMR